jgi:hypothetical protein
MKNNLWVFIILVAVVVSMPSCRSGFSADRQEIYRTACKDVFKYDYPEHTQKICDCYVNELTTKFPSAQPDATTYNAIIEGCFKSCGIDTLKNIISRDDILKREHQH